LEEQRSKDIVSEFLDIPGFWIWRVWQDAMHGLDLGREPNNHPYPYCGTPSLALLKIAH
jgi:hypothetical protein